MNFFSFNSLKNSLRHEASLIFFSLVAFLLFPWFVRRVDMTSAPLDPGIISVVLMAVLSFLVFKAVTWWVIRVVWPVFAEYSELHFERNFNALLPLQKVMIYLTFYMLLLMGFVFTLSALI